MKGHSLANTDTRESKISIIPIRLPAVKKTRGKFGKEYRERATLSWWFWNVNYCRHVEAVQPEISSITVYILIHMHTHEYTHI